MTKLSEVQPSILKYGLSFQSAMAVYAVLPLCSLIILYDQTLGSSIFYHALPENPSSLALYNLLFGLPHIIAGHIVIFSKGHFKSFKYDLLLGSFYVISSIVIAGILLPMYISLTLFIVVTLIHVLKQQFGMVKIFSSIRGRLVDLWTWNAIMIAGILASIFSLKSDLGPEYIKWGYSIVVLLNISFVILGGVIYRNVKTRKGKYFFLVNLLSIPLTTFFYFSGYTFFAILTVRVIHDATAYMVYLTHDKNKNCYKNNDYYASLLSFFHIVVFSIAIAFLLENYLINFTNLIVSKFFPFSVIGAITISLIAYVEMMHYYLESKAWKQLSPCRKYVAFTR